MKLSDSEKVLKEAVSRAKQPFGAAWVLIPKELRVMHVQSAALGIISGQMIESYSVEVQARLAHDFIKIARLALQYEG